MWYLQYHVRKEFKYFLVTLFQLIQPYRYIWTRSKYKSLMISVFCEFPSWPNSKSSIYLFGGKAGHLCSLGNKVAHLRKSYKGHKQSPLENLTRHMTKSSSLTRSEMGVVVPEPGGNCGQSPAPQRHWLEIFLCQLAAHIWDRIDCVAQSRKRTERKERHQFDGCTDPIVCTTTQRAQQRWVPRDTKEPLVTWHQSISL